LHCKIEGPAAYDILTNFEQRWKKATKWRRIKKVTRWHDDALIKLERISWILTPSSSPDGDKIVHVTDEGDPENWHVQVCISCFLLNIICICEPFYWSQRKLKLLFSFIGIPIYRFRICEGISKVYSRSCGSG